MAVYRFFHPLNQNEFQWDTESLSLKLSDQTLTLSGQQGTLLTRFLRYQTLDTFGHSDQDSSGLDITVKSVRPKLLSSLGLSSKEGHLFIENIRGQGYRWLPVSQRVDGPQDLFFAYDSLWVGRRSLLNKVATALRGPCRLTVLVGLAGIGKTALGECLVLSLEDWLNGSWNRFHQENFDHDPAQSGFALTAIRWLESWGVILDAKERSSESVLLRRLLDHLKHNRRILQLDSVEMIMVGNEQDGWSDFKDPYWEAFFRAVVTANQFESRLILTSQDMPGQIESSGARTTRFWQKIHLTGFDPEEQQELFVLAGMNTEAQHGEFLTRIGAAYEGHPLALRVLIGEILQPPFSGDVVFWWRTHGSEIEAVEKAARLAAEGAAFGPDDPLHLHRFTRNLRKQVMVRLALTFERLERDHLNAYRLLCMGSVYRCAVPDHFWLAHGEDLDLSSGLAAHALETLRERFLVESVAVQREIKLRLHNLIRSVALEHLQRLAL